MDKGGGAYLGVEAGGAGELRQARSQPPVQRQQSAIRRRYNSAVRAAAEATASFFGLSDNQGAETEKWKERRAELLRRRFGKSGRQITDATTAPFSAGGASLAGDQADFIGRTSSVSSRPHSLPPNRNWTITGGATQSLPLQPLPPHLMVQEATPQRGFHTQASAATPMSIASTTMSYRRRPSLELCRKESVSSLALNTLRQAVRRTPSSRTWGIVQEADSLPSPMDGLPYSDTPLTPAFMVSSLGSVTPLDEMGTIGSRPGVMLEPPISPIPEGYERESGGESLTVPRVEEETGDIADAAMADQGEHRVSARRPHLLFTKRTEFASTIPPSIEDATPITVPAEDIAQDLFFDLPRPYFVNRGMLDHVLPSGPASAVLSRFSHLSAIPEAGSSSSSLRSVTDETDVVASVVGRSFQSIPAVFDDPDLVPKLSSLEGEDIGDGFFQTVVERTEQSTLPFRIIARCLGRNDMDPGSSRARSKPITKQQKKAAKKANKISTFDSNLLDNRAFFTYWITIVHVAIFLFSVISYGIAPIGVDVHTTQEMIMREWGVSQLVSRVEPENMWIGPSQASLVHLGARYAPCMRSDSNIDKFIESERVAEEESGCCIRNDRTGCIQSTKTYCADALSTWLRWPNSMVSRSTSLAVRSTHPNATKGPVCGLDPDYCLEPSSVAPFNWSPNITKWPICLKQVPRDEIPKDVLHMHCDVIGRPCCVGLVGQCILTTREYCEFQNGYFHQEAYLCSQVSCMGDVCGMIPFADDAKPDQFYRLWTSLFLHAGVLHLVISIAFQMTIMRHLEKYAGWLRISLIYLLSGLVGNLASAIFTPYHAEAGPTGSHFGLIACLVVSLIVDIVNNRAAYISPCLAVLKIILICVVLFAIGLLPFIDNWAHVFGFAFGAILSCMLLPDVQLRRMTRASTLVVCLILSAGILTALVLLFYFFPVYECEACAYFNCIPFTPTFCATRRIKLPNLVNKA